MAIFIPRSSGIFTKVSAWPIGFRGVWQHLPFLRNRPFIAAGNTKLWVQFVIDSKSEERGYYEWTLYRWDGQQEVPTESHQKVTFIIKGGATTGQLIETTDILKPSHYLLKVRLFRDTNQFDSGELVIGEFDVISDTWLFDSAFQVFLVVFSIVFGVFVGWLVRGCA